MAVGPSPLIPFVIVVALGLVIYGGSLLNSVSLVADAEQTAFDFVLIIPLLVLLFVYFISKSIIFPLTLLLLTYMVGKMLLGPLVLIFIIYLFSSYLPYFQPDEVVERGVYDVRDGTGLGWGSILLLVIFLALYGLFYQGEGYERGLALLAMLLFILYNLI